jgi:hypothetical protein
MRVLITAPRARSAATCAWACAGRHELLRLLDVAEQEPAGAGEEVVTASVADGGRDARRRRGDGRDRPPRRQARSTRRST